MAEKKTIHIGAPLRQLLEGVDGRGVSRRINTVGERYETILAEHGLGLAPDEQDVLRRLVTPARPLTVDFLVFIAPMLADWESEQRTAAGQSLLRKLRGARPADLIAEVERLGL